MPQKELFPSGNQKQFSKYGQMARDILEQRHELLETEYKSLLSEYYKLQNEQLSSEQLKLISDERILELEQKIFGSSSEKLKKGSRDDDGDGSPPKRDPKPRKKSLRDRYPNVAVRTEEITMDEVLDCSLCGKKTQDTGLRETAHQLTVIPKRFEIVELQRTIYGCKCCQGGLVTTPVPERIIPGSSYSDEMIIDVALSKYSDLIPIERYTQMAARHGVEGLPPQSLIECTHHLGFFLIGAYKALKDSILSSVYLSADETPHRMLEGSDKKSWYLWGFSSESACYFEHHDTRSGDVSIELLKQSKCEILLSDKYSGYDRTIKEVNLFREKQSLPKLHSAYCNTHSRRYFFKIMDKVHDARFYVKKYSEIYKINAKLKGKPPDELLKGREEMRPLFEAMKTRAEKQLFEYSEKSKMYKALNYFLGGYKGLTLCLEYPIDLDNNKQESLLRAPVVGRKTWYGTHSERGAHTAAVLFSLVESCKMNSVNPREYFPAVVEQIKKRQVPQTPAQYRKTISKTKT